MWKLIGDKHNHYWMITKTSGFITLTFDLVELINKNCYRLSVCGMNVFRDFKAKDFEDAKLQANELIYDALRWNN